MSPLTPDNGPGSPANCHNESIVLTPAQQSAVAQLEHGLRIASVIHLSGGVGRGKSTILHHVQNHRGGAFFSCTELLKESDSTHPLALEEVCYRLLIAALRENDIVFVDDIDVLIGVLCACHFYPRSNYFDSTMLALSNYAIEQGKKLVLACHHGLPATAAVRACAASIERFRTADYALVVKHWLGEDRARNIDSEKIFRFAPKLNGHQLRLACEWFDSRAVDTDSFIEYLRSQRLASHVDLEEVQQVDLHDLEGVGDVLRSLEINIILPLENDALASELQLRPKRGVLLYGPPGTGKTTVGRALAHRLKGKFFLIDGTYIAGTSNFYERVHQVFESAKDNAPSVIFFDDADAIFQGGEEQGLYRYLLTMLDGLESESAGRICVMMTAMDVDHLPAALVRSGRVELWLEMRMPGRTARQSIIGRRISDLPASLQQLDYDALLEATEGFTGADLKRLIEDAKALYAYDSVSNCRIRPATEYMLDAVKGVRENKTRYTRAHQAAIARQQSHAELMGAIAGQFLQESSERGE